MQEVQRATAIPRADEERRSGNNGTHTIETRQQSGDAAEAHRTSLPPSIPYLSALPAEIFRSSLDFHATPQSSPARDRIGDCAVAIRKRNLSVYDMQRELAAAGHTISINSLPVLLREEGFSRLPRRADDERPVTVPQRGAWPSAPPSRWRCARPCTTLGHRNRAFVVCAAGKTREALLTEQDGEGIDADGVAGGSEFALHVIDGEIALAHGHRQITDPIAGGRRWRSALRLAEEGGAFLRVVAELITQDAEGTRRVTEATGGLTGQRSHNLLISTIYI